MKTLIARMLINVLAERFRQLKKRILVLWNALSVIVVVILYF